MFGVPDAVRKADAFKRLHSRSGKRSLPPNKAFHRLSIATDVDDVTPHTVSIHRDIVVANLPQFKDEVARGLKEAEVRVKLLQRVIEGRKDEFFHEVQSASDAVEEAEDEVEKAKRKLLLLEDYSTSLDDINAELANGGSPAHLLNVEKERLEWLQENKQALDELDEAVKAVTPQ